MKTFIVKIKDSLKHKEITLEKSSLNGKDIVDTLTQIYDKEKKYHLISFLENENEWCLLFLSEKKLKTIFEIKIKEKGESDALFIQ